MADLTLRRTARARGSTHSTTRALRTVALYALLIGLSIFILAPLGWMLTAALKPRNVPVFTFPPEWLPTRYWNWATFRDALFSPQLPFARSALNTLALVALNELGTLLSVSLVAYPFARLRFRGRELLFTVLIVTMLIPGPVLLIPQFLLFHRLGWVGTYMPLWVPSFTANAFLVFLVRQYMRSIPRDLDEAARIDGAGFFTIWWRLIVPLSAPALAVAAVFTFLGVWNDLLGPLIYLNDQDMYPVALALATLNRRIGTQWNVLMAANLVAVIPPLLVYFFAQKQLVGGIASVGLKG
ncbi:MAG: carbohydrate ABC transporter permease [Chloroflexales bacterium]|nr:carbohydrate ABC transporter permease [Chloroflexales bacterium]